MLCSCTVQENQDHIPVSDSNETTFAGISEVSESETEIREELPDVTFDDYNFRVLNVSQESMNWIITPITSVEETGETINDALYRSTMTVTNQYGFQISEITEAGWTGVADKASRSIRSDSDDYDIVITRISNEATMAQEKLLVDYNSLLYVDLDKPWWDGDMADQLSIDHKIYFMAGDMSLTHYDSTCILMFNKQMLADYPVLENPYELVKNNQWTFEKFKEFSQTVVTDLNGDGEYDENDRCGYVSLSFLMYPSFFLSADSHMVVKDSDDIPKLNLESEAFQQVYSTIAELLHTSNMVFDADLAGDSSLQLKMFENNQALFWTELANWSMELRNMENDFGILPIPKMDVKQENYCSYVYLPNTIAVPVTNQSLERTSIILEALCAEGHRTIVPAYYEKVLKSKVSRDNESEEMLDIIFAHRNYELAYVYWPSGFGDSIINNMKNGRLNISTWVAKNLSSSEKKLEKTLEKLVG